MLLLVRGDQDVVLVLALLPLAILEGGHAVTVFPGQELQLISHATCVRMCLVEVNS